MASEGLPSPRVQPEEDVGEESPIRVIVRVRPVPAAAARTAALTVRPPNEIHVQRAQGDLQAGFDAVLGPDAEQAFVYDHVGPAVDAAIQGLNSTVFAYGQTGSGKTHTLFGGLLPDDNAAANAGGGAEFLEGMAARALRQLFAHTEALEEEGTRLAVSCSFLEIYNEHLSDLLLPAAARRGGGVQLALKEDECKEVYVRGLSEVPTHSVDHAFALVRRALRSRSVRQTEMNERSSRSHAVLQLVIEGSAPRRRRPRPAGAAVGARAAAVAVVAPPARASTSWTLRARSVWARQTRRCSLRITGARWRRSIRACRRWPTASRPSPPARRVTYPTATPSSPGCCRCARARRKVGGQQHTVTRPWTAVARSPCPRHPLRH